MGLWYNSGSCARFSAQPDTINEGDEHLFTLTSSKGPCGITHEQFQCAKSLALPSVFSSTMDGKLAYKLNATFYAHAYPQRYKKIPIYIMNVDDEHGLEVEVSWVPLIVSNEEP